MQKIQLETERLLLRDFKATDWKPVQAYAADEEVVRFMEWGPNSSEESIAFIDMALDKQRENPRRTFEFAVTLKSDNTLIGALGMRLNAPTYEVADVGYCFNKKYWQQGYAKEACARLLRMAFLDLELRRIWATCDADNVASAKTLLSCGMTQEGHFREDRLIKGRWRDTLLFAILRDEWESKYL